MSLKRFTILLSTIALCQMAGVIGSFATMPNISTWYSTLILPAFNPPSWVFGPAWILLYTLMGISLYLIVVSRSGGRHMRTALLFFYLQLILNAAWSVLFFGLHSPLLGFLCIIGLVVAVFFTMMKFYSISRQASGLLLPYFLWILFASVLNGFILFLN